MGIDTLFQPVSGAGTASSGDYVKDHFLDTSRPATNNSGLTDSASVNPLGFFFNNTDTPTYGVKTLYIKDAVLIEDRSKWISRKPTYEITFTEYNPAVRAYAVGNIRVRNSTRGKCIEMRSVGDIFGVTGIINQLAWNLSPSSQSTASALAYTDGVSGSTFNFNSAATDSASQGVAEYDLFLHSASVSSTNIHDFRLEAQQAGGLLAVEGIVAYFSSNNIVCRPGSTYNDKQLVTTSSGSTLPLATITGALGGKSVIYKSSTGTYTQATNEPVGLSTMATGLSGTNLITVTTGTGASFAAGYGILAASGTSQYYGIVSSVSTDTLTVGPTLAFPVSSVLNKLFSAGPTFAINASMYKVKNALDPYELNNAVQTGVFGATLQGEMFFGDVEKQYYVFGKDLQFQSIDGYLGLGFEGNTSAFLQVDGNFAAADIEYMANGILNATFSINGVPAWSQNSGASGIFRATVFTDAGPGWNSFVMSPGQSHTGVVVTKINLYDVATTAGLTAGLLSEYQSFQTNVTRAALNATLMPLGAHQRVYADQLFLQGGWTRGVSHIFAGNVAYFGATANCVMKFQYFGKDFGLVGTEGGSMTLTLDGASISSAFNAMKSVASMTWHSLELTYKAGATSILQALSFQRPTQGELVSLQQKEPRKDLQRIPQTFIQSDTPREAKDGDVWVQQKTVQSQSLPNIWFRFYGLWNRAQFNAASDDPNVTQFVTAGGAVNNGGPASSVTSAELFNGTGWQILPNMSAANSQGTSSDNGFAFGTHIVDGYNTSSTVRTFHETFRGAAWASETQRSNAKVNSAGCAAFNFYSSSKGTNSGSAAGAQTTYDLWSGSSWTAGAAWANSRFASFAFFTSSLLSVAGGIDSGGSATGGHEQKNAAAANSAATNIPVAGQAGGVATIPLLNLAVVCNSGTGANTVAYTWNGASWSSAFTTPVTQSPGNDNGAGCSQNIFITSGGYNGSANFTTSVLFNGSVFYIGVSRSLSRDDGNGGTLGI